MAKLPKRLTDIPAEERKAMASAAIEKYEQGEKVEGIAKPLGITPAQLYRLIVKERPDDWREVRAARVLRDLEEAGQTMKDAKDHLALAKADKLAARAAWELERLSPKLYGPKQVEPAGIPVQININLRREPSGRVIEQDPLQVTGSSKEPEKPKALTVTVEQPLQPEPLKYESLGIA